MDYKLLSGGPKELEATHRRDPGVSHRPLEWDVSAAQWGRPVRQGENGPDRVAERILWVLPEPSSSAPSPINLGVTNNKSLDTESTG